MTYEYRCNTCGKTFEKEVKLNEIKLLTELGQKSTPRCKHCNSSDTKKIISLSTPIFKGNGFTKAVTANDSNTELD